MGDETDRSSGAPAAALRELAAAGRLAAAYPRVCALVAALPEGERLSAGHRLAGLDHAQVGRAHPELPVVSINITGHGTLGGLVPALAAELARHGLVPDTVLGDFGGQVAALLDGPPRPARSAAALTLCVLDPHTVFDEVPVPWRPADVERAFAAQLALLRRAADRFHAADRGTLVLNTVPLPGRYQRQLVDQASRARLGRIWREANGRLLELAETHPAVAVVDLDPLVADGVPLTDPRLSAYAKAHLSQGLLTGYAREVGHLARRLTGRTRKCLVLDLDGTLWGGVLGEDGPDGVEVGDGYRGEAFLAFQRVVRQLGSQGVLLAVATKNEPDLVARALREHPRLALREPDLVQVVAGWGPKPDALRQIAAALGIGTDSLVFVDDSAFEREHVRRELPEVAIVAVDGEPALHPDRLLADGWFDVAEVTAEDRGRTALYRGEAARQSFLTGFDSVGEYLRELGIWLRVGPAEGAELARVSQLTLRTNQFNLTGQRLQPADVRAVAEDAAGLVVSVRFGDRFGDGGLVGAVLARRAGDGLRVANFLLSCRVFGRSIEDACLVWLLRHARDTGARAVHAAYRPLPRNHRVADFYPSRGFVPAGPDDTGDAGEGGVRAFRHDLRDIPAWPEHIRLVPTSESEPRP